ncbi:MAG: cystathionine gamma-lyase [Thermoprotei archaeon]|nr:MAG: cystathionine gamma-lyase [Thermoprotei archaeon]RLF24730.1 MAG: cystathionine gamma-lyase [Thermoprotei archaeon]
MFEAGIFRKLATKAIHSGELRVPQIGNYITPIFTSAIYRYPPDKSQIEVRKDKYFKYGREDNPTVRACELKLASIEGGEDALLTSSGMSAIMTCLMSFMRRGLRIVAPLELYGATVKLISMLSSMMDAKVNFVYPTSEELIDEIGRGCDLVFLETMSNPLLRVLDIPEVIKAAHEVEAIVIVDNTFTTPCNFMPINHGADLVVHSCTKYLAGHNDVVAGAIIGEYRMTDEIWEWRRLLGTICDPFSAYLTARGLKTLHVRMKHINESARAIAEFLYEHPKVGKVYYPALPDHPTHDVAIKLLKGFGGVVSFELKVRGQERVFSFMTKLKVIRPSPSLGGCESLIIHPATSSHKDLSPEERMRLGITDELVRLYVGLEDVEEIKEDLDNALRKTS